MGLTHVAPSGALQYLTSINVKVKDQPERPKVTNFADLVAIGVSAYGDPAETYTGDLDTIAAAIGDKTVSFSDGYSLNPVEWLSKAANPSPDPSIGGAKIFHWQDVGYETKTRAEWALLDGSGNGVATLKRRKPGLSDMRVLLSAASHHGATGLKISIMENGTATVLADDLGPAIYVDGPADATLTTVRALFTPATGGASEDRMISLECKAGGIRKLYIEDLRNNDYYTLAQVAAAISAIDGGGVWDAYVADGVDPSLPSSFLDKYTNASVSAATLLTANIGSMIYALTNSPFLYCEKAAAALDTYYTLPALYADYTAPTTPGAFTSPSTVDWCTAIDRAEDAFDLSAHVIIATTDQTVVRYLASRVDYHRQQGDMCNWRAIVGHPATSAYFSSLALIKDDRRRINSYNTVFVGASEFYDNAVGQRDEVSRSCLWAAAGFAGMRAGNYRKSMTNKQFNCNGLVRKLTPAERKDLVANRVTFLENKRDGSIGWQRGLVSYSGGTTSAECNEFAGWIKWYLQAYFQTNYQWVFGEIIDGEVTLPALKAMIYGDLVELSSGPDKILTADPSNPTAHPAFTLGAVTFNENALGINLTVGAVDEALWMDFNINFSVQRQTLAA